MTNRICDYVNKRYKTHISIGEISYDGWSYFSLRQAKFGDQKTDTTFYAGRVQFNILGLQLDSTHFILNDVVVDEGLCKITTYKDGTYSLNVIYSFFNPNDTVKSTSTIPFILEFRNVECMDSRFMYVDSTKDYGTDDFDPFRIHFYEANVRSKKFTVYNDSLHFDVRNLSVKERSGFSVTRMNGLVSISDKIIQLDKLDLLTPNSHIKNYVSLNTKDYDSYDYLYDSVVFNVNLQQSEVDMKDLSYFLSALKEYHYKTKISATVKGTISDLSVRNIVALIGSETKFTGNVKMKGLPVVEETFMDINADYCSSIRSDLEQISAMKLPDVIGDLGKIVYRGHYTGFYNDFVSYGVGETQFGNVETDINMKLNPKTMLSKYSGNFVFDHFNLGALLKNNKIGVLSLNADVDGEGFDLNTLNSNFNFQIAQIDLFNYNYTNTQIKGRVKHKKLSAFFDIQDTNIILNTQLNVDFSKTYTHVELDGNVGYSDLKDLHLNNQKITMSTDLFADFHFKNLNDNYGVMKVENVNYTKDRVSYVINELVLESEMGKEELVKLNGDFIKATVKGQFSLTDLSDQLIYWTSSLGGAYFKPKIPVKNPEQNFKLDLKLISTASISPLLFPGYNASNVELHAEVNSSDKSYSVLGFAGLINLMDYQFTNTTLKMEETDASHLNLLLGIKQFGKADTLYIGDFALKADASLNLCNLQFQVSDTNSLLMGSSKQSLLFSDKEVLIDILPSLIGTNGSKWENRQGKNISLNAERISITDFTLFNANQILKVDGYYSFGQGKRDVNINLQDFDLKNINLLLPDLSIATGGITNGFLNYKKIGQREVILSKLKLLNFSLDQDTLGDYDIATGYRENDQKIAIDFESLKGKINNLKGTGIYGVQDNILDLDLIFNESEVNAFQAFVKDYAKIYSGKASLKANLKGHPDDLKLKGNIYLSNAKFKIEYLQTIYTLPNANFVLNEDNIKINPFEAFDVNKNKATVSGVINHNGFKKFSYHIKVDDFKSLQVLNTNEKDNELFNGLAYASGDLDLIGSESKVQMNINVKSEKGTKIMINPFGISDDEEFSIINYVDNDTIRLSTAKAKNIPFGIGINLNINATPNAEIQMLFDTKSDDRIKAKGSGKLNLKLSPDGEFLMFGDYEVSEGDYRFSALNVVAKKFDLRSGSRISWTGDPMGGDLKIIGVYKLRASLGEIVNMSNAPDPKVRVPVECLINIKGSIDKPQLYFDLNFPDLQSSITGSAASELNAVVANFRKEPEIMNQQMLFLLISGSFIPLTNSINNAANGLGSQTVSDLLSKQAAGLLGKIVPGIDLNVDLLNATDVKLSRTVVLSASKRFLDNRLELQGSYATDNTQSNFSAAYNIKKNGNTKLKLFNRTGFDPIYNRNVVTSGLGLFYKKESDRFIDLFKKQNPIYF